MQQHAAAAAAAAHKYTSTRKKKVTMSRDNGSERDNACTTLARMTAVQQQQ